MAIAICIVVRPVGLKFGLNRTLCKEASFPLYCYCGSCVTMYPYHIVSCLYLRSSMYKHDMCDTRTCLPCMMNVFMELAKLARVYLLGVEIIVLTINLYLEVYFEVLTFKLVSRWKFFSKCHEILYKKIKY